MAQAPEKRGFSGQSLVVGLGSESQVFRGERPWLMSGGGPPLNRILGRALDRSFTYLQYLDEYGDTVFNKFQMDAVIPELLRLMPYAESEEERTVLERIISMAEKVRAGTHRYLVFMGD